MLLISQLLVSGALVWFAMMAVVIMENTMLNINNLVSCSLVNSLTNAMSYFVNCIATCIIVEWMELPGEEEWPVTNTMKTYFMFIGAGMMLFEQSISWMDMDTITSFCVWNGRPPGRIDLRVLGLLHFRLYYRGFCFEPWSLLWEASTTY